MKRLKQKWGLESAWQVIAILLVFSLAGSTAVAMRKVYFYWLGIQADTAFWIKALAYILFLFPAYQCLLLIYGFLLGQFHFFWQKELKMIRMIQKKFVPRRTYE